MPTIWLNADDVKLWELRADLRKNWHLEKTVVTVGKNIMVLLDVSILVK